MGVFIQVWRNACPIRCRIGPTLDGPHRNPDMGHKAPLRCIVSETSVWRWEYILASYNDFNIRSQTNATALTTLILSSNDHNGQPIGFSLNANGIETLYLAITVSQCHLGTGKSRSLSVSQIIIPTTTYLSYNGRVYIAPALKANMKAPIYQNTEPVFYDMALVYRM